jgi:multiple sugar transport system permease protein
MMADKSFWRALGVTVRFVFVGVPLQLAFALLLAVLFKRERRGIRCTAPRTTFPRCSVPASRSPSFWRRIFNKTGLINPILALFGVQGQN